MAHAKNPEVVQAAERFLWKVLLTDQFDHLFQGFPWMPREAAFLIEEKIWETLDDETRIVVFMYNHRETIIRVTLKSGPTVKWAPSRIEFERLIRREDLGMSRSYNWITGVLVEIP